MIKSKKANRHLNDDIHYQPCQVGYHITAGVRGLSLPRAIEAVELAETEARERMSFAFCRGCVHRPFSCRNAYNDMCPAKETFLKNYDLE